MGMYQSFDGEMAGNSFALRLFTIIIRPLIEKRKIRWRKKSIRSCPWAIAFWSIQLNPSFIDSFFSSSFLCSIISRADINNPWFAVMCASHLYDDIVKCWNVIRKSFWKPTRPKWWSLFASAKNTELAHSFYFITSGHWFIHSHNSYICSPFAL